METIKIMFRKFGNEVACVFPYQIEGEFTVNCYAHIGQHSQCNWDFMYHTKPAKFEEFKDLMNEISQIYSDYKLEIITRRSHAQYLKALETYKTERK